METNVDQLEDRIDQLKNNLFMIAKRTGMNSPDTIACSQELDQLILLAIKSKEFQLQTRIN